MTGFFVTEGARSDIDSHVQWLLKEAGAEIARRFAISVTATFGKLSDNAGLGSPVPLTSPRLGQLRKWKVATFPKVLIFYRDRNQTVEIIRVIHATQDWI